MSNGTEKNWETLLAGRPLYQQKVLKHDFSLTPEESGPFIEWAETQDFHAAYSASWLLLKQNPTKLRALRKQEQRKMRELSRLVTDMALPKIPAGAPKKEAFAREAVELKNTGLSYAMAANRLNLMHAKEIASGKMRRATTESVRKLIKRFESAQLASPRTKPQN